MLDKTSVPDSRNKQLINDDKLYELALANKQHKEDRRDQINSYYISLFAAIIAAIPFIDKITENVPASYEGSAIRLSLTALSLVGLVLAITWAMNLKRTLLYLESLDQIIMNIEKKYQILFVTYIKSQLEQKDAPGRVTKYQLVLPYTFIVIFSLTIIYSLLWLILK